MTNYLIAVTAIGVLGASACSAGEPPAAAKPTAAPAAKAAAASAARLTAAPAGTSTPGSALPHYVQSPAGSNLTFSFMQAGAENQGVFKQFVTAFDYDEKDLAASNLRVTVQIGSFETQDKDRNDTLASAELLDSRKFPTAQFVASSLTKGAKGIEAVGKLTLHGVTKDIRVPLTIRTTAGGLELSGETTLKRLDYGVGQGDWKSTEWVADEIKLKYQVSLARAAK
jgi:polyisoprenoid-binding protein YceI